MKRGDAIDGRHVGPTQLRGTSDKEFQFYHILFLQVEFKRNHQKSNLHVGRNKSVKKQVNLKQIYVY